MLGEDIARASGVRREVLSSAHFQQPARRTNMPKYISFFSYTRDAVNAMIAKPSDRGAAAKALVESVGGKLECFYWMHGPHDGFFIADYKDGASAAAVAAAAGST